jgi:hypothetical protein
MAVAEVYRLHLHQRRSLSVNWGKLMNTRLAALSAICAFDRGLAADPTLPPPDAHPGRRLIRLDYCRVAPPLVANGF